MWQHRNCCSSRPWWFLIERSHLCRSRPWVGLLMEAIGFRGSIRISYCLNIVFLHVQDFSTNLSICLCVLFEINEYWVTLHLEYKQLLIMSFLRERNLLYRLTTLYTRCLEFRSYIWRWNFIQDYKKEAHMNQMLPGMIFILNPINKSNFLRVSNFFCIKKFPDLLSWGQAYNKNNIYIANYWSRFILISKKVPKIKLPL